MRWRVEKGNILGWTTSKVKLVFDTNNNNEQQREQYFQCHVDDIITKKSLNMDMPTTTILQLLVQKKPKP